MKRILFVDDEPRILEALQRMLRSCRDRWEMTFAGSGSEALETLAAAHYDVIVTDMRMPGMDGAQLLELARDRFPEVIRIVLSGQFETDAAMRAAPVAHQFLTKPCDPAKLQDVIQHACESDALISDFATRRTIAAIGELPALPRTYAALVAALDDPTSSLDQVSSIVERDVAVTAKVLQLVNSAFFGLAREVSTIPMAVGYLGFDVLKQLVMAVELFRTFTSDRDFTGCSISEIQRHSRCVAAIAARLPVAPQHAAVVPVAALLHDVGKLVLAIRLPEPFESALEASLRNHRPLYCIEQETSGTSHAEVGAYLLRLWGLPSMVTAPVAKHHRRIHLAATGELDTVCAVHVADLLEHEVQGRSEHLSPGGIEDELPGWTGFLPAWRKSAEEIVRREAQCPLRF